MSQERPSATVYFDGACPLCSAEIAHYKRLSEAGQICFVDAAQPDAQLGDGLDRQTALARFHIRGADGRLHSGAAAFVALWNHLPRWRWAARFARLPGVLPLLELVYRTVLPLRPGLARTFKRIVARSAA